MTTFNDYQLLAARTAIYPNRGRNEGIYYAALGLNGEAGEVAEIIKKSIRDTDGAFDEDLLLKEVGDCLWYLAELCSNIGVDFGRAAELNIEKLSSRMDRGVISGSGDNR